jgi:hypothetical protein
MNSSRLEGNLTSHVTSGSMELAWAPEVRLAAVRFGPNTIVNGEQGSVLVASLAEWIGSEERPFALLADTTGVRGADAEYRVKTSGFFKHHRDTAIIAITHLGPVIRIVAEMFRIGTGIRLKAFAEEAEARAWLRIQGIGA